MTHLELHGRLCLDPVICLIHCCTWDMLVRHLPSRTVLHDQLRLLQPGKAMILLALLKTKSCGCISTFCSRLLTV